MEGTNANQNYWCHSCENYFQNPVIEQTDCGDGNQQTILKCPRCNSDFVEVLEQPLPAQEAPSNILGPEMRPGIRPEFVQIIQSLFGGMPMGPGFHGVIGSFNDHQDTPSSEQQSADRHYFTRMRFGRDDNTEQNTSDQEEPAREFVRQRTISSSGSPRRHVVTTIGFGSSAGSGPAVIGNDTQQFGSLEELLQNLFQMSFGGGVAGGMPAIFAGGSEGFNFGDFAWGQRGLDDIITQLMEQTQGRNRHPASEEEISKLPRIELTEQNISSEKEKCSECPVCREEFQSGETLVELVCKHRFHQDCITEWLRINGTCPVCRRNLKGEYVDQASPGNLNAQNSTSLNHSSESAP